MQVLTKFYCPKLKTLVLAGFLRAILKLKKCDEVPEELHGVPAEEALMSRATMLGTSQRSYTHIGPFQGKIYK
jgi:hypothetical protein